jgi:hypothetical protein
LVCLSQLTPQFQTNLLGGSFKHVLERHIVNKINDFGVIIKSNQQDIDYISIWCVQAQVMPLLLWAQTMHLAQLLWAVTVLYKF